jgi:hypothetical protein
LYKYFAFQSTLKNPIYKSSNKNKMTQQNTFAQHTKQVSIVKPILVGAAIGLILISTFVFRVDNPKPEWGKLWMIRPLIITPMAGALGGLVFYFMNYLSSRGSINKFLAILLSLIVFIIGLWMGIVVGLDGTLWD